jgi:hypothetical protein
MGKVAAKRFQNPLFFAIFAIQPVWQVAKPTHTLLIDSLEHVQPWN